MSASLCVSNLPSSVAEEVLAGTFERFGAVLSVKLKRDPETDCMHRAAVEIQAYVHQLHRHGRSVYAVRGCQ